MEEIFENIPVDEFKKIKDAFPDFIFFQAVDGGEYRVKTSSKRAIAYINFLKNQR